MSKYVVFENFANDEEAWSRVRNPRTGYISRKFTPEEVEANPELWEAAIRDAGQVTGDRNG